MLDVVNFLVVELTFERRRFHQWSAVSERFLKNLQCASFPGIPIWLQANLIACAQRLWIPFCHLGCWRISSHVYAWSISYSILIDELRRRAHENWWFSPKLNFFRWRETIWHARWIQQSYLHASEIDWRRRLADSYSSAVQPLGTATSTWTVKNKQLFIWKIANKLLVPSQSQFYYNLICWKAGLWC